MPESNAGVIRTLYSDSSKTEAIFPRSKVSAISDDNNNSLDYLLSQKMSALLAGNNISISDNVISATGVAKSATGITILKITQAEYEALTTKDSNTLYLIV